MIEAKKITEWNKEYELREGNTFKEISYYVAEIINGAETPINIEGAEFKGRFVNDSGTTVKELSEEDFDLTNAANGYFKIKSFVCEFEIGIYYFDVRFKKDELVINTPIEKLNIKRVITSE